MRAPTATNNELIGIIGIAALIAAAILYFQKPAEKSTTPIVVVQQHQMPHNQHMPHNQQMPHNHQMPHNQQPNSKKIPALNGVGPGWTSGRWLGEGDFKHFGQMDHPFKDSPPMHFSKTFFKEEL